MGWSSGSSLASAVIEIMESLHEGHYVDGLEEAYKDLIAVFEDADCDNLHECLGESVAFDSAWYELYPQEE